VQLLGDVDQLEVCGEGAGEHDRRGVVDAGQQAVQRLVPGFAGLGPDFLDQGEEVSALVPGQRLTEELAQLPDRGAQRGVLRVRRHAPAEPGHVERSAVGVAVVLRRHTGFGGLASRHARKSDSPVLQACGVVAWWTRRAGLRPTAQAFRSSASM
jgi:hypothetical protein